VKDNASAASLEGAIATPQLLVPLEDASQVSQARREATRLMSDLDFDEHVAANVALAVTEAATNVLKHATRGHLLMRALGRRAPRGIEILAIDKGRGIANIAHSLRDGYSTAGSLGAGMSAFARLASSWDIYSQPGKGTVLRLEFWSEGGKSAAAPAGLEVGAVCLPRPGETANGDTWAIREHHGSFIALVADGLGHGPDAAAASLVAADILAGAKDVTAVSLLGEIHRGIASTRGAAVGLAVLDPERQVATFAGVGNISAAICASGQSRRHLVSRNGIVGHNIGTVREMAVALPPGALLLAHSDGLGTHWDLGTYEGIAGHHPAVVAAALWRDFVRGRDDVTVLAIRFVPPEGASPS
jgi:anti-sigma regulatory factor (Ser/Thr protein kinase)